MNIFDLFKLPDFFYKIISSLINRIDALIKRNKRKKEIKENIEYDGKIDEMIEDVLIEDINKELGWDNEK